ncbi:hypothetical protein ASC80_08390 [Afipia sp. Root123D2]|nr:hypothetical protein ASC80_08390 [Afipia sp. Root123D2]
MRTGMATLFASLRKNKNFATRSIERDAATDFSRLMSIYEAIDQSLSDAEAEKAGLRARLDSVLSRAAMAIGNGDDEYLSRDAVDTRHLDILDAEIRNGEQRIETLTVGTAKLLSLKETLLASFPELASKMEAH